MSNLLRREIWLRLLRPGYNFQMAIISVIVEGVMVNEASLAALMEGGQSDPAEVDTWYITYPIMAELLSNANYRKWEDE